MNERKPKAYFTNVAFLMVFDILMESGSKMMALGDEVTMNLDINKKDIYKSEKKLKEMVEKIAPFKESMVTLYVKQKVKKIIFDVINLTKKHEHVSPEIVALHLLFNYFCDTNHIKIHKDFDYFANTNNYYSILDRLESSKLVDANLVYMTAHNIISRNR